MDEKPTYQELEKRIDELEQALQKGEGKYRILLDESSDPTFSFYPDGTYRFVNQAFAEGVGKSIDEIIGHRIWDIFPGEEGDKRFSVVKNVFATGKSKTIEVQVPGLEGDQYYITTVKAVKDNHGKVISVICSSKNITDRKQTEETLRESEERHRLFFENAPIGIIHYSNKGIITAVNEAMATTFGSPREKLIGLDIDNIPNKKFAKEVYKSLNGKPGYFEGEYSSYTGKKTSFIRAIWIPIKEKDEILAGVGIVEDITERKKAEEALRLSEGKLSAMLASLTDHVSMMDRDLNILWANDTAKRLFGEDLIGKKCYQAYHGKETPCEPYPCLTLKAFEDERMHTHETQVIGKDGQVLYFHCTANVALRDDNGNPTAVIEVSRDITEHKRAEEALHESEEKFRTLVEKSPLGISLIANDGRYKYINPQFTTIFGYTLEDIPTGNAWFKKSYPDAAYRQKVIRNWIEDKKQINLGQARPRVFTVTCKDGAQKKIHFRPVTMENHDQFVIYEDVTEKSSLEHQLLQAQKFEAIGTLAGGIAHDFNNLLMGIQGRASLMSVDLGPSHSHIEHIKSIEECIRSATGLTKQLLGFARGGKYEVKPININDLVCNSAAMFSRTRKEINVHTKNPQTPLIVEADQGQIEQVLLNLYVNAWQAMPNGGELYLETSAVVMDDDDCEPYKAKPGRYAKVSVTDTGIGMNENTRRRIFDPFFTTKEKGRGTGLGLASAYGIIKNHGGIITVYSERNHGTTFNIYLQISEKAIDREIATDGGMVKGSGTILLVDDEDMIINVGQALLESLGYQVITVKSGEEAAEVVLRMGSGIDLVILDMIMPGMDGGKTFDRIREINPQMPVLLSSGYAVDGQATEILRRGCNGFIQKPFNIANLSQKIRNIVDAAKDGSKR